MRGTGRMHGPFLPKQHGPHLQATVAEGRPVSFLAADGNWVPSYDAAVGPQLPPTHAYQANGRGHMAGYANNPLDPAGREAIVRQLTRAPLGGHVRRALEGHTLPMMHQPVSNEQAHMAERALAGVLATGVGGWGLLSAIDALNGGEPEPQMAYYR